MSSYPTTLPSTLAHPDEESRSKDSRSDTLPGDQLPTTPPIPQFDFAHIISQSPANLKDPAQLSPDASLRPRLSFESERRLYRNTASHRLNAQHSAPSQQYNVDPSTSGLHIRTDLPVPQQSSISGYNYGSSVESDSYLRHSTSASSLPRRTPSIRAAIAAAHTSAGSLSPGSVYSSPQLAALTDITPLPSPIGTGKDFWKGLNVRSRSRASSAGSKSDATSSAAPSDMTPTLSPPKRRAVHNIKPSIPESHAALAHITKNDSAGSHSRNRSLSEYVPEGLIIPKQRNVAVSGSHVPDGTVESPVSKSTLHREEFLGAQRGITAPVAGPPTPPKSTQSGDEGNEEEAVNLKVEVPISSKPIIYTARSIVSGHVKHYKSIRELGRGTFSTVMLAVRQIESEEDGIDYTKEGTSIHAVKVRSRRRVAVKIVEHGPAGGADEERVEVSLQREVEILKSVTHPSIVHLKAFASEKNRALLVLNYCPGGDLFEAASLKHDLFVPGLIRRVFSELVSAVRYLHQNWIVHRDIKLENILLNIPTELFGDVSDWGTEDRAIITLTDLGLSRRIPLPPESPLLQTRCGSEDYAAPEILMGQPYDGRQTDAWALGVVLYAMMEGRLPFDALPGARGDPAKLRARTPHRIARVEWSWYKYADEDGEWDSEKGKDVEGGRRCVEGLLKRTSRRKGLDEIVEMDWVRGGIAVPGGLKQIEEEAS